MGVECGDHTNSSLRLVCTIILFAGLWALPAPAADAPASPQTTFFHANALYKDGQYAAAARQYEEVLRSGLESGNLYFNLGNAYFKAGERGRAILNYERAARFMPGDPDLEANLTYARSLTGANACAVPVWHRLVFPLANRMSTGRLAWMASVLYTLLLIALTIYRVWSQRPRWVVYGATALAALLVVAGTSLARQVVARDWQRDAVVVRGGDTPVRFEPADDGTVHYALQEGSLIQVLDSRQDWLQVARCDGRRGWIELTAVEQLF